jgi:tripartite-type tricarboxylate transporter receptor subunit TctC
LAQKLGLTLGQNFVVENQTGASGMIGAEFVAKSDADGYARAAMLAVAFVSDIRQ